jgi:hypothetical protein
MTTVHLLKCDGNYWDDVATGRKTFEVRKDDRTPSFEPGHVVALISTAPGPNFDKALVRRIGYLARGGRIPEGYCVFELLPAKDEDITRVDAARGGTRVSYTVGAIVDAEESR